MIDSLPKVSICTAVWNGLEFTEKFVGSLKQNKGFEYELVIVDNGSDPHVSRYLKENADIYYRFEDNQGFCKGFNKAAELATCDYLVLINNDTMLPDENWWGELYKELTTLKNCGLIFPCVNNVRSPINAREKKGPNIFKHPRWEIPVSSGVAMVLKKDVFEEVGGFDESYVTSGEDSDFQCKIWQAGYDVYITERVFIEHIGKATSFRLSGQEQLWKKNVKKFKNKWKWRLWKESLRRIKAKLKL